MTLQQWIQICISTLQDFRKNIQLTRRGVIRVTRAEIEQHIEDYRAGRNRF